jgi:hypothetical protein
VTPSTLAEPVCPGASGGPPASPEARTQTSGPGLPARTGLIALRCRFDDVPRATWDRLAGLNPWATPFSSWAFQRAWWDAYGANATDETLVLLPAGVDRGVPSGADPVGIVPLMRRHEAEPADDEAPGRMRHSADLEMTDVPGTASAIFFGASYHADYASLLAAPWDLGAVSETLAAYLAGPGGPGWDVIDLRRLRCGDPAAGLLAQTLGAREVDQGWTLNLEREDVCPVITLPAGAGVEDVLATLGKKDRHEIRRKIRRAAAVGPISLTRSTDPLADLPAFIDLHQARWGAEGLFPDTPGGRASRLFFRRLFELMGPDGPLVLSFLAVGDRRIGAGIHFEDGPSLLYYNAGMDPAARELSPGVLMVSAYLEAALAQGFRRMDFLRGDEPYKYEWGAHDEPIQRLLVRRRVGE